MPKLHGIYDQHETYLNFILYNKANDSLGSLIIHNIHLAMNDLKKKYISNFVVYIHENKNP